MARRRHPLYVAHRQRTAAYRQRGVNAVAQLRQAVAVKEHRGHKTRIIVWHHVFVHAAVQQGVNKIIFAIQMPETDRIVARPSNHDAVGQQL